MVKKKVVRISKAALMKAFPRQPPHASASTAAPPSVTAPGGFKALAYADKQGESHPLEVVLRRVAPSLKKRDDALVMLRMPEEELDALPREQVIKAAGEESPAALRVLLWALEYGTVGASGRRARGTEGRVRRLLDVLEANDVDWEAAKLLSKPKLLLLCERLRLRPTERLWLAALLRNPACGALLLSQDGKHVCLRETSRRRGSGSLRCRNPYHAAAYAPHFDKYGFPVVHRAGVDEEDEEREGEAEASAAPAAAAERTPSALVEVSPLTRRRRRHRPTQPPAPYAAEPAEWLSTRRFATTPPPGCARAELRQHYGRSVYPVREAYEEEAMQRRVEEAFKGEEGQHTIDSIGPVLELLELRHDIARKQLDAGAEASEVGGPDDTSTAMTAWSYALHDTRRDMVERRCAALAVPGKNPARTYQVTLLRLEHDKGGPGDYRKKVTKRRDEWLHWVGKLQRMVAEALENVPLKDPPTVQAMVPPSVTDMQAAVDKAGGGDGDAAAADPQLQQRRRPPNPLAARMQPGLEEPETLEDVVFRAVDPSRAVTVADTLPVMPSVIVTGKVVLVPRGKRRDRHRRGRAAEPVAPGGSLEMKLRVLVHSDVCFDNRGGRYRSGLQGLKSRLASLPLPPAVMPFSALFRVDPLSFMIELDKRAVREDAAGGAGNRGNGGQATLEAGASASGAAALEEKGSRSSPQRVIDA